MESMAEPDTAYGIVVPSETVGVENTVTLAPASSLIPTPSSSSTAKAVQSDAESSVNNEATLERVTTFAAPQFRRGVHLSHVLSCFGRILASSKGSARTFLASRPVMHVRVFISHNWSTKRLPKFLALAYHFNFVHGLLWSAVGAIIVGILISQDVLHGAQQLVLDDTLRIATPVPGPCCITSQVMFMLTLLMIHDVAKLLGLRGPVVFLDKTCIHQTDPELQRIGIEGLSAFMNISDEMLIVFTDTYLQRLWTVYELASMLILNPRARITVVGPVMVLVMWTILACLLAYSLAAYYQWQHVGYERGAFGTAFGYGALAVVMLPLVGRLRRWAQKKSVVASMARDFCIRSARCAVEADRKTVFRNVTALMRGTGFVGVNASQDLALDSFEMMARELVPTYLKATWGHSGIPLRCSLCAVPTFVGLFVDLVSSTPFSQQHPRAIISAALYCGTFGFALFPLWLALLCWLAARYTELSGWRDAAFTLGIWLSTTSLTVVLLGAMTAVFNYALASWVVVLLLAIVCGFLIATTAFVYRPMSVPEEVSLQLKVRCTVTAARSRMGESRGRTDSQFSIPDHLPSVREEDEETVGRTQTQETSFPEAFYAGGYVVTV